MSAFRTPNCTVAWNRMVSDVTQTNTCIHFFSRVKQEIFVSDNIFIILLVLVPSLYPIIFLKLFRYTNFKSCSISISFLTYLIQMLLGYQGISTRIIQIEEVPHYNLFIYHPKEQSCLDPRSIIIP